MNYYELLTITTDYYKLYAITMNYLFNASIYTAKVLVMSLVGLACI